MRLGLIGSTGHWQTYAPALQLVPGLKLVAVAAAGPEETTGAFDHAPGQTVDTNRYDDARKMLDVERLDVVQVCGRCDRIPVWIKLCLERGLPVMAEKPLAMDLPTLKQLYQAARKSSTALVPMHTMRGVSELATVRQAVRDGEIGNPVMSFSQKTYKWGKARPDFYRSRETFPGLAPWVGIHAFDWLYWILGDQFTEVIGREGTTVRPDFPACGSQAAFVMTMRNGGVASLTLDYLRPTAAPSHADERLRIAGTHGVIETALIERKVILTTADSPPRPLDLSPQTDIFTQFARSLRGEAPPPLTLPEACRITEIAIKAQEAVDTGRTISLGDSPYHTA
ncbi:Gfo/Idh/MocA family protein [Singulisphaera acidiphila]|uniref:Putative dehydrogenase n=1 Tax=Singulisphaera acidiphila (strain ATCC BAA-1392 / DSM 18658 / VKM B-2454 / MOB10) TaxID=886293 RepID=L0DC74_SINAD|nr:Gfo/Idh/MocA family oxidoreductase [Singulisphaera acidiphila]AGA26428.1 putative dehydrogenase [Singulisphaera acidiphila DSM 18658]